MINDHGSADNTATRVAPFGFMADGSTVEVHTLLNSSGMEVCFLNLGGIISAVKVPDRDGVIADITPGYDFVHEYLADPHYFGALIGRVANRIAGGRFSLDGVTYSLSKNEGDNVLHGGAEGFHRALWTVEPFDRPGVTGATLAHTSPDGSGGFPGELRVQVTYLLTDDNELTFEYEATCDQATPVNLTQHFYINLAGHDCGTILDHDLTIEALRYLPVGDDLLPTGDLASVEHTPFDFRSARRIGDIIGKLPAGPQRGFDHTLVLDKGVVLVTLYDPKSGRIMEIETTEPGLQFYTGNQIPAKLPGKGGAVYTQYSAMALETQHFPDSVNQPSFPNTILRPNVTLRSRTTYRFRTDS